MDMAAEGSNKMMDLMHQNMSKMQEMEMTGDVDHDFAMMMAIHHQGAIAMSEEEVNNGTDPMLKEMANKTIASSKTDIQKLSSFTSNHQPMAGDASKSMKLMQPMKDMMGQMEHGMQGTTDHHFAKMMSMHHQQGIDMSKVQVAEGKTPAMKQMAQKIIDEQEKDKQKLDNWLQEHPQQK
ncbi:hypothetical protein GCM10023183_28020 [Nibribacter koreensis]|uniref:DUF305 domain-containing protein n=2 Tax=Nibribacter koreensis TaxID=1084519 RepID=A0ABP8FT81_9BACT